MPIEIRTLGRVDYAATAQAMHDYTARRGSDSPDAIWLCEHAAVYTQGLSGRSAPPVETGGVALITSNRGGRITYHGPGQVVAYAMIDLRRAGYFVKEYVYRVEEAVIRCLAHWGLSGHRVAGAPGVYLRLAAPRGHALLVQRPQQRSGGAAPAPDFEGLGKIAALGIKVSRHCSYHGVALNVAMDLAPFERIAPCGYAGLRTVDLSTIGVRSSWDEAAQLLGRQLATRLVR